MTSGLEAEEPLRYDEPDVAHQAAKRRVLYVASTVVVTAIVGVAIVEALFGLPGYGIDTNTVTAAARGTTLEVRYARATRGQLASPLEVTVRQEGGFDGPVTLAMSNEYLALFITNDLSPAPSSETSTEDAVVMTFDTPPQGDTLSVHWDVVAKPAAFFTTKTGTAAVLDDAGDSVVAVSFTTQVRA